MQWPNGKRAAVSLSFDDARSTQLDQGLPILNACGVKATFYVSFPPFERRIDEWRAGRPVYDAVERDQVELSTAEKAQLRQLGYAD